MWQDIVGHDDVADRFRATLRRGRLASTYLFVGPAGIGKRRFALALAKALLCQQPSTGDPLEPCGSCDSCRLFAAGSHPDLEIIGLPKDKSTLPLELFIGDKDHRNQDGLCHRIALRPFLGGRKVAIIDDADRFSQESANSLLKTLEEPPPKSLLILIGTSPSKQLPTIRSRSQVVRFQPLPPDVVADILVQNGTVPDRQRAVRLASYGEGSIERAAAIADPKLWQFRERLLNELSGERRNPVQLTKSIQAFVDEAGKEPSERRDRLRTIVGFAVEFYRGLLRADVGTELPGDEILRGSIRRRTGGRVEMAHDVTLSLDNCLAVFDQVDRNANLGLVIQNWCESLAHGA